MKIDIICSILVALTACFVISVVYMKLVIHAPSGTATAAAVIITLVVVKMFSGKLSKAEKI